MNEMDIFLIARILIVLAVILLGSGVGVSIYLLIKGIPEIKMIWRDLFPKKKTGWDWEGLMSEKKEGE
jgi:hypothetical protein